mgnify:CR=1 FL=1
MKTCFLVYRVAPDQYRELVSIFSTKEKAIEFMDTLEKFISTTVYYEYEEWGIE